MEELNKINRKGKSKTIAFGLIRFFLFFILIGLVVFPQLNEFKWKEDECVYNIIFNQSGDIDLATIGSSRVKQAVYAPFIEEEIKKSKGENWVVRDLSHVGRDISLDYIILKNILDRRRIKRVMIEFNGFGVSTDITHYKGSFKDLSNDVVSRSDLNLLMKTKRFLSNLFERTSKRWEQLLSGKSLRCTALDETEIMALSDCSKTHNNVKTKNINNNDKNFKSRFLNKKLNSLSPDFDNINGIRSDFYLRKIIDLTHENETEVFFVNFPRRYGILMDEDFMRDFENTYGVKYIQPEYETLKEWSSTNSYVDAGHLTLDGSQRFSKWLTEKLFQD